MHAIWASTNFMHLDSFDCMSNPQPLPALPFPPPALSPTPTPTFQPGTPLGRGPRRLTTDSDQLLERTQHHQQVPPAPIPSPSTLSGRKRPAIFDNFGSIVHRFICLSVYLFICSSIQATVTVTVTASRSGTHLRSSRITTRLIEDASRRSTEQYLWYIIHLILAWRAIPVRPTLLFHTNATD